MRNIFRISALAGLALGSVAVTAHAQGAKSFGIVAGVDFANMSGSYADSLNAASKTGFIGGFYLTIPAGSSLSIEPEVLYVSKGAQNSDSSSQKLNNSYIEIPVLLKYNFRADGGPYLLAGPAVAFSISCNTTDGSTNTACDDSGEGLGLQTNTTFGGVIGLGFMKNRFGLEGRYDFDFGGAFKDINAKNNVWEILARIMIK